MTKRTRYKLTVGAFIINTLIGTVGFFFYPEHIGNLGSFMGIATIPILVYIWAETSRPSNKDSI